METTGILIEPEGGLRDAVLKWKSRVEEVLSEQVYCTHPPHCTLINTRLKTGCKWVDSLVGNLTEISPFEIEVGQTHMFPDDIMARGGQTLAFRARSSDQLRQLQEQAARALENCTLIGEVPPSFKKNGPLRMSFLRCGFPFVGDHWIPHFTVASLEVPTGHPLIKEFMAQEPNYSFRVHQVSVWRIDGDCHRKLATFQLEH